MIYVPKLNEEKKKSNSQIVEEYLAEGKSVDLDFLDNKGHDVKNLSIIISRLKKKYPYIDSEFKVGKSGKQICVYSMPM